MKPLQVGLLVVGAALAGGLAVKMTQPAPFPTSQSKQRRTPPYPAVTPVSNETTSVSAPLRNPDAASSAAPPPVFRDDTGAQKESPKLSAPVRTPVKTTVRTPAKTWAAPAPAPKTKAAPIEIARSAGTPVSVPPVPYQPTPQAKPDQPQPDQTKPEPVAAAPHADAPAVEPTQTVRTFDPPAAMPSNPAPLQVTLRQGAQISVRMDQALSSDHLAPGDTFQASLAEPLVVDGYIVAERGARVAGRVVEARIAGRLSGNSTLGLSLATVQTADGQKIAISTEPWVKQGDSSRDQSVAKIGGGAALGAIIGAIAGGGAGAAIGAGVGGAAGTGAAAASRGKPVNIASETVVRFRLASSVKITERPL